MAKDKKARAEIARIIAQQLPGVVPVADTPIGAPANLAQGSPKTTAPNISGDKMTMQPLSLTPPTAPQPAAVVDQELLETARQFQAALHNALSTNYDMDTAAKYYQAAQATDPTRFYARTSDPQIAAGYELLSANHFAAVILADGNVDELIYNLHDADFGTATKLRDMRKRAEAAGYKALGGVFHKLANF